VGRGPAPQTPVESIAARIPRRVRAASSFELIALKAIQYAPPGRPPVKSSSTEIGPGDRPAGRRSRVSAHQMINAGENAQFRATKTSYEVPKPRSGGGKYYGELRWTTARPAPGSRDCDEIFTGPGRRRLYTPRHPPVRSNFYVKRAGIQPSGRPRRRRCVAFVRRDEGRDHVRRGRTPTCRSKRRSLTGARLYIRCDDVDARHGSRSRARRARLCYPIRGTSTNGNARVSRSSDKQRPTCSSSARKIDAASLTPAVTSG